MQIEKDAGQSSRRHVVGQRSSWLVRRWAEAPRIAQSNREFCGCAKSEEFEATFS